MREGKKKYHIELVSVSKDCRIECRKFQLFIFRVIWTDTQSVLLQSFKVTIIIYRINRKCFEPRRHFNDMHKLGRYYLALYQTIGIEFKILGWFIVIRGLNFIYLNRTCISIKLCICSLKYSQLFYAFNEGKPKKAADHSAPNLLCLLHKVPSKALPSTETECYKNLSSDRESCCVCVKETKTKKMLKLNMTK